MHLKPSTRSRDTPLIGHHIVSAFGSTAPAKSERSDVVFTAPRGGVIMLRNWRRRVFDPALERAGLGDLTPHELRHTAASLAVVAGANVKAVQRMLGHASPAMTLDVYSGPFDGDLHTVADRLDAAARTPRQDHTGHLRTRGEPS